MDPRERTEDDEEVIRNAMDEMKAHLWTAVPVRLVKLGADGRTGQWQPTIKATQRMPDGTQKIITLPLIDDAPIHYPGGGGATITFPLKAGDEGLAIISSRSIDGWDQSGEVQKPIDARTHDLSDAMIIPGFKSKPNALGNISTTSTQIRTDDGKGVIDLHGSDGITTKYGGLLTRVSETRVDLGGLGGDAVETVAGPSSKVFAIR